MATQNYGQGTLNKIDERFYTESKTGLIINKGIKLQFNGKQSVTIYNVDVVDEVDYQRHGDSRFGDLVELGTGVQTFTLSQDKSFTFSVDQGNLEDSEMVTEAHKAVKRQVREVSIPNTDKFRLSVLAAYAAANGQVATSALANTDIYQKILVQNAALDDAEVDEEGRVLYISPTNYNLLKRDSEFMKACDTTVKDLKRGIMGEVDGLTIVKAPASYFIANFGFMIVYNKVLVAPTKFDMTRVLTEQRGIHGAVAEGRRYYDAFIPQNKGLGIRLHKTA